MNKYAKDLIESLEARYFGDSDKFLQVYGKEIWNKFAGAFPIFREFKNDLLGESKEDLEELLKKAAQHIMTPQEVWDQRVSFVYGQLMESNVTREEVEKRATETYGPRPS